MILKGLIIVRKMGMRKSEPLDTPIKNDGKKKQLIKTVNCPNRIDIGAIMDALRQLAISLAARNLFQAQSLGQDLLVMCAGCSNRLRVASNRLREDSTTFTVRLFCIDTQF